MVHYTKVAGWLIGVFVCAALMELVIAGLVLSSSYEKGNPQEGIIVAVICGGGAVFFALLPWLLSKIHYEITATELVIHAGPIRLRYNLTDIFEVYPTNNPLSAPAASLDRLHIGYRTKNGGTWFTLISPKDKEAFVRDLAAAAPQLKRVGDAPLHLKADEAARPGVTPA
jgi:hypothetical protein